MLRNRYRKANTATLPFRIRNNFKRLPNRFSKPQDILSDNDGGEIMLQGDPNDDNVDGEDHDNYEDSDNDDDSVDGEDHDNYEDIDNDDDNVDGEDHDNYEYSDNDELRSNNDEESDATPLENDYAMFLESDEDYAMFLESDEDSSSDSDTDISSEEKLFVDAALDEEKLPSFDGDFAPYFKDFTTAALFCWIHKHNISTNAYEDLIDIIMKPEFNRDHIVKNIRRFRTWRERLPLPSISAKSISISSKKTPSTSKDSKMAYQLSISDIIWHVLNNPSLSKDMYFGPGVDSETKSEYWHGTLWAESPLFGQAQLMISEGN
jgi:hypothetical protein